jgi:Holliday junction DNA helicase RuvB
MIEKAGDLAGLLTTLERGDILFIDEIHRLQPAIEEYLYPAMEDFRLDIIIDQGPNARSVRVNLPRFTLVGATTRAGLISAPLRSRFGMTSRLDYYGVDVLSQIARRSAGLINIEIDDAGAREIASRARGTPRVANNLLRWVRDYAQVKGNGSIDRATADRALHMLDIDDDGLDEMDKRILEVIVVRFQGGPVGLGSLSVAVGEDAGTIEEVNEPYLIQEGFLKRTSQGRVAMPRAYQKLGIQVPTGRQSELF